MSKATRWLATFAAAFLFAASSMADAKQFFRPQGVAKSSRLERPPGVVSQAQPIQFNADEMLGLARGEEIELNLPNAVAQRVVFEHALSHGGDIHSWIGHFKERGISNRVMITTGPSGSFGVIEAPRGTYRIVPGNGHDWLVDMNEEERHLPRQAAEDDSRIPPPLPKTWVDQDPTFQLADPGSFNTKSHATALIDVMVVVTQGLANSLGANLMTRLHFLFTRANQTYHDSEVNMKVRLVKVSVVNYSGTDAGDALDDITPVGSGGTGAFANVEAERAAAAADMVSLMLDGGVMSGNGVAWVGGSSPNPLFMYSVVRGCTGGCESVWIHELGHNMGNKHDRYTDAWQEGPPPTQNYFGPAFPYGYGYAFCMSGARTCNPVITNPPSAGTCTQQPQCSTNDASNFRDIMAYFQSTTREIYRFSNALQATCAATGGDGALRPCGIADPASDSADTAKSMNLVASALSGLKTAVSAAQMPGSLQFTQTTFSGNEAGGTVTFTVSRMRDSTIVGGGGPVQVSWSLTNGTATAGNDFTNASGTLSWADGDFANKTFSVTVANDGTTEGSETFTASLSNPSGAAGVFVGYPFSATGVISEPWPPNGAAPAGFSSASTPAAPWAVAADSFDAGGGDTTSFQSGAFASAATGNSSTVFTGNFTAGTIAFSYRVSSYPGLGLFEFLVDGVVVHTDSGDTGLWESFATNVTGGAHTLEWRYRKTFAASCANIYPVPGPTIPPFPNCQDRVWIDTVVLPLAGPTANPARISNISTRMQVLTGNDIMIAGFIIGGSLPKTVVISVAGPHLGNFGIANHLQDPTLTLVRSSDQAVLATNDNWQTAPNAAALEATGFAPNNPLEPAIMMTLPPGAYTAQVQGAGGLTGVGLVGVFEVDLPEVPLVNISTRGQVLTGNDRMIAGFIVSGDSPKTVVVNVAGPHLGNFGIANHLANPTLTLVRSSDQAVLATNDNWQTAPNMAAIQASGFAPNNPLEPAIMMTLPPGAYTAIVEGAGGSTGVGLVGVFTVP